MSLLKISRLLQAKPALNILRHNSVCGGDKSGARGKVGLITGGSIGIGFSFAKAMLANGAKGVVLGDIRVQEGEKITAELNECYGNDKAIFLKCDATNDAEMRGMFECAVSAFGQLDVVCNNAGLLQDKNWELMIDVNVKGVCRGTFMGFEYMGKHAKKHAKNGGAIVNVASILGLQPCHGTPVYDGTKHFLVGFDRSMGHDYYYKMTDVRVLTICPGVTETNMIDESEKYGLQGFGNVGKVLKDLLGSMPSQSIDDTGNCLVKILSKGASGSVWVIEGGECFKVDIPDRHTWRDCNS